MESCEYLGEGISGEKKSPVQSCREPARKFPPMTRSCGAVQETWGLGFDSWVRKIPGEGNGNPLQYSCLENPMDKGAWWATVYGVAQELCLENLMDGGAWKTAVHGVAEGRT